MGTHHCAGGAGMSDEQINQRIAEACGWTSVKEVFEDILGRPPNTSDLYCRVPNYAGCLNAMHEAVSIFDYDQADEFEDHLCDICKRLNDKKKNPAPRRFAVVNATSAQRAEAFLRTIEKWEDEAWAIHQKQTQWNTTMPCAIQIV